MIRVIHPGGSGSWFFTHPGSRIQGVKKAPDPGSATLVNIIRKSVTASKEGTHVGVPWHQFLTSFLMCFWLAAILAEGIKQERGHCDHEFHVCDK